MARMRPPATLHPRSSNRTGEALLRRMAASPDPTERKALVEQVTEEYLGLADALARQYAHRGVELEDLTQVARMGLVLAVDRFVPQATGCPFEAFAVPTIRGELRRYFRDHGWLVRPPRRIQELRVRVREARHELEQAAGRRPTAEEMARCLRVDPDEVRECDAADACFSALSLDAAPDHGSPVTDLLGENQAEIEAIPDLLVLRQEFARLTERERRALEWRFVHGLTQSEIGARLGVSQMQVSRILSRVLEQLRVAIDGGAAAAA